MSVNNNQIDSAKVHFEKPTEKNKNVRYTSDGAIIEGTALGGLVLIVSKTPQFIRDVCPYFQTTGILVFAHLTYIYTGNLCLCTWFLYLACPISNFVSEGDNTNLSIKSEKAFLNDKRFWYPLWAYNTAETITWIWALIVMSD